MAQDFKVPELGENIETGTVVKVFVAPGQPVKLEQPVVELETGKAVVEIPSNLEGTVDSLAVKPGDEVRVGQVLFTVNGEAKQAAPVPPKEVARSTEPPTPSEAAQRQTVPEEQAREESPPRPPGAPAATPAGVPAAPSVRRLARELNIDLVSIKGTGPNGRVTEADVRARVESGAAAAPPRPSEPARPAPAAAATEETRWGPVERQPMGAVRKVIARHLAKAWAEIPHVTQFGRADVTEAEALRQRLKEEADRAGVKLSLTVMIVKVLAGALKAFPRFNASVDMERGELVLKHHCHIGVAMDTPRGLVVPVIRDADRKNLIEVAADLKRLTDRAREGKLAPDEMEGGCMTVSNAGALGGDAFTPIVNWPEVAILGIAKTVIEPVWRDGSFQPRPLLPLALSYDHRVIDGADGVRFMAWVVAALEDPVSLLWKG